MEVTVKHESTVVEPIGSVIGDGMQAVSTNSGTIAVLDSYRNIYCSYDTEVMDENSDRPLKKPKIEEEAAESVLPAGFLDPLYPDERTLVIRPQLTAELESDDNNSNVVKEMAVVPSMIKQFWKAGDYEASVKNSESISHHAGMDHVRVHPRFLHSNATSHKWALGAFAELLDNSLDEVRTGATYVRVDVLNNENDTHNKMLLVEDNGGGMTPAKMRGCMSLGYSAKSKLANTIGQYGNGFKTSTMRLGADVIVFTRCPGQDGRSATQSIGMLSYTFLMETGKEDIVVPMIDFEKKDDDWRMLARSSPDDWKKNMETLVQWSPYSSEEGLLQQFNFLDDQGTRIIIYNLWGDDDGQLELDFDTDPHDIQIRGVNRDPKKIEMAKQYPNSRHFLTYRHSLRSYAAILYRIIPDGFRIILRGQDVDHHNIVDDMMLAQEHPYKPADQNMVTLVTIGFVKDAKDHIDVQGFNVYHKNRLIKPFWRVWNAAGSDGRGVIGVLEANFVEPAHDKQGFERTTVLSRLENRLVLFQKKYWSTQCQEIGYAKRCKTVPVLPDKAVKDKSDQQIVLNPIDMNYPTVKLRPIRKLEALKIAECEKHDEMPPVCIGTSRINRSKETISFKESKASNGCSSSEPVTTNGDVHRSADFNIHIIAKLTEEYLQLRQRLETPEGVMVNNLLQDLQSERDKVALLEDQVLKGEQKIEEDYNENTTLIDVLTEERQRRDQFEADLMKKYKEALDTIKELRNQIKMLNGMTSVKREES